MCVSSCADFIQSAFFLIYRFRRCFDSLFAISTSSILYRRCIYIKYNIIKSFEDSSPSNRIAFSRPLLPEDIAPQRVCLERDSNPHGPFGPRDFRTTIAFATKTLGTSAPIFFHGLKIPLVFSDIILFVVWTFS